ncbi:hypothetical protein COM04_06410 [Bacillus wiedmannii]|uniref:hypothetical protein n=1 Tax=Bacillus wiedmannii TaxID=1890302 RepID=UPI000BEBE53D|nr:hypothetical protein [Bacillus wiedmannii]PEG07236.1 hypothetical protein CON96_26935 [Bacillus wiedmannii]PEN49503.1 hypothetical protein CN630_07835 [Bacillus wiedmannii]PEN66438.1 hypothetical protein CN576_07530 [Bacillus wiedmannii]PEP74773.1 hypothetical protein CN573_12305 [Bacillus wiedmannii]PFX62512.1 hypothetical protein COL36_08195 [Bacillus wiedmannii]
MKKFIYSFLLCGLITLNGCVSAQNDYESYWVLEKSSYNEGGSGLTNLYEKAQEDPTMVHYSNDSISEGKRLVYLAFGKNYKNDENTVQKVIGEKDTSVIVLQIEKGQGKDENPVLYIGVPKLRDSIKIVDTDGKKIFEMKKGEGFTSQQ